MAIILGSYLAQLSHFFMCFKLNLGSSLYTVTVTEEEKGFTHHMGFH